MVMVVIVMVMLTLPPDSAPIRASAERVRSRRVRRSVTVDPERRNPSRKPGRAPQVNRGRMKFLSKVGRDQLFHRLAEQGFIAGEEAFFQVRVGRRGPAFLAESLVVDEPRDHRG